MNRKRDQVYRGKISSSLDPLENLFGNSSENSTNLIALELICLPAQQPRHYFDPSKMEQLVQSVKTYGILEPLLLRPLENGKYELVAGERRYRAARTAGLTEIPATVRELDDNEALQLALVENLQREDLNPVEETEGILQLLALEIKIPVLEVTALLYKMANELKGKVTHNIMGSSKSLTIQEIFKDLGLMKWESFVANRLPLLNLPADILEVLRQGKLAYTKAQAVAVVKDEQQRQILLDEVVRSELSLAQIRERISALKPTYDTQSPKVLFKSVSHSLSKSKTLWDDPKKAKKIVALIKQMETLLDE